MAGGAPTKVKKKKKSVLKRNRQTIARTEVNRANRTQVRSLIRKMRAVLTSGDASGAEKLLGPTFSGIDQAIRKGVLKENTGNRYKSRLAHAYNALASAKK